MMEAQTFDSILNSLSIDYDGSEDVTAYLMESGATPPPTQQSTSASVPAVTTELTVQEEYFYNRLDTLQNIAVLQLIGSGILAGCVLVSVIARCIRGR